VRRWNLIDLAAACLFPLVPALLLYGLFSSQNSATYDNAGLKLGGPVALYFVLVLLAFRYVGRWRIASDPFEKLKKDLVGAWDVEAVSATAMAGSLARDTARTAPRAPAEPRTYLTTLIQVGS
jgi:hypothetical protein